MQTDYKYYLFYMFNSMVFQMFKLDFLGIYVDCKELNENFK